MATKRGLCPYCDNTNLSRSIFLVNPEASIVFCGTNMHQIAPIDAINAYNETIKKMIARADNTINVVCDPGLAYQEYADVLAVDDTVIHAYFGRILCLIYMSTVRKTFIEDATILLKLLAEKFTPKVSEAEAYYKFYRKLISVTEEYQNLVNKRVTFREYYYDTDCLKIYLRLAKQVVDFETVIYDCVLKIKDKYNSQKIDTILNYLNEKVTQKEYQLSNGEFILASGEHYKFIKSTFEGVEIEKINKFIDTKVTRYRMATLDQNNKELRQIKDEVFRNYTKFIKAKNASVFWFILLFVIALGSAITASFFFQDLLYFIILVAVSGLALIGGIVFLSLFISWSNIINKKKKMEVF